MVLPLPLPPAHNYYLRSWCYHFRSPLLIVTTCARGTSAALPSISGSRASAGGSKCRQPPPRCPPLYFQQQGVGRRQQMPPAPAPLPSPLFPAAGRRPAAANAASPRPATLPSISGSRASAGGSKCRQPPPRCPALYFQQQGIGQQQKNYYVSFGYRSHSHRIIVTTCARGATASAPPCS